MHQQKIIEQWINSLKFNVFFKNLRVSEFIDRRDSVGFYSLWKYDYDIMSQYVFSTEETSIINDLRKKTYRNIYQLTTNAKLAAFIRDDIELIIKSIFRKRLNLWNIWHLWSCYLNDLDPTII